MGVVSPFCMKYIETENLQVHVHVYSFSFVFYTIYSALHASLYYYGVMEKYMTPAWTPMHACVLICFSRVLIQSAVTMYTHSCITISKAYSLPHNRDHAPDLGHVELRQLRGGHKSIMKTIMVLGFLSCSQ